MKNPFTSEAGGESFPRAAVTSEMVVASFPGLGKIGFDPDKITSVKDQSDMMINRLRINFKNGYAISVISGFGTHGYERGLIEIAIINRKDEMDGDLLDPEHRGDIVSPGLTAAEVRKYINKIGNLSPFNQYTEDTGPR